MVCIFSALSPSRIPLMEGIIEFPQVIREQKQKLQETIHKISKIIENVAAVNVVFLELYGCNYKFLIQKVLAAKIHPFNPL